MMNNYLAPCPICGGDAKIKCICVGHSEENYYKLFKIVCTKCNLSTDEFNVCTTISDTGIVSTSTKDKTDKIKEWNNRSGSIITEDGWIPIKTIEMTEDEKKEYKIKFGGDAKDERYACPLPEDGQDVLITTMCGSVLLDTFNDDGEGVYFNDHDGFIDIKAWKPLPEPYKAECENKEMQIMIELDKDIIENLNDGVGVTDYQYKKLVDAITNGILLPETEVEKVDVLDKIKAEIIDTLYVDSLIFGELIDFRNGKISADDVIEKFNRVTRLEVLKILDKYKSESEDKE